MHVQLDWHILNEFGFHMIKSWKESFPKITRLISKAAEMEEQQSHLTASTSTSRPWITQLTYEKKKKQFLKVIHGHPIYVERERPGFLLILQEMEWSSFQSTSFTAMAMPGIWGAGCPWRCAPTCSQLEQKSGKWWRQRECQVPAIASSLDLQRSVRAVVVKCLSVRARST